MVQVIPNPYFDSYITHDDIDQQSKDNEAVLTWDYFKNIAHNNNNWFFHKLKVKKM